MSYWEMKSLMFNNGRGLVLISGRCESKISLWQQTLDPIHHQKTEQHGEGVKTQVQPLIFPYMTRVRHP